MNCYQMLSARRGPLFDTVAKIMPSPVCQAIGERLMHLLQITLPDTFSWRPSVPITNGPVDGERLVVLAPFIDSGFFRVTRRDVDSLVRAASMYVEGKGLKLVLIGSAGEKNKKAPRGLPANYDDWRGRFRPAEFAAVMASGAVDRVFTFDTFIAHIALACGLYTVIKMKKSLPKKHAFLLRCIIPPFPGGKSDLIKFL